MVKPDDFVIDSAKNAFADPTASRFRSSDEELAGIESLAGVTNGVLLRLTPSDRSAFARIARESAGYYLVGFEPRPNERNGAYHRVDFNVARAGTRVKALPNLMIAKTDGKKPALTPQAMLRDGKAYPDLPLRVLGLSSPNPGDTKLTVVALVEPFDPSRDARVCGVRPDRRAWPPRRAMDRQCARAGVAAGDVRWPRFSWPLSAEGGGDRYGGPPRLS